MSRILIQAGWVIPVARPPIEHGGVLIEDDRIVAVDTWSAFEGVEGVERQLGDQNTWLLPGFVNSHYHSNRSFQLGYSEEPGELGLFRTFSQQGLPDPQAAREYSYLNTLVSAIQLVRSGVTTTIDMAWGGRSSGVEHDHAIMAYRDLGLGVVFAPIARDRSAYVYGDDQAFLKTLPERLAKRILEARLGLSEKISAEDYLAEWQDLYERFNNDLTRLILALDGSIWCSDELSQKVSQWGVRHGLPLHLHQAEAKLEVDWALATLQKTSTAHLQELGALRPTVSYAHGIWLSDADIEICARHGVSIAHTPSSELRWYCGIGPVVDLLEAGVNVCLGSDGNGFADDNDFLAEMRMASLLQRLPGYLDWPAPPPETIIAIATINGARAFGLEGRTGTLEPGKRADLALIDGSQVLGRLTNPGHDVRAVLIQRARAAHVRSVLIAGKVVLQDGKLVTLDEQVLVEKLRNYYEIFWSQKDPEREKLIEEGLVYVRRYFKPWEANLYPARYRYNRA